MATNSLLVRWANGWSEEVDAGAIAASERQEGYLQLGAAQSISEAGRLAIVQLSLFSDPRSEITTGIAPVTAADAPYLSFNIGDTVSVPDEDGSPTLERVLNLTVTEDRDTGRALFNPGLRDVVLEQQARVERTIKQMSNGTLSGISTVATPVAVPRSPSTPSVLLFPSNTPFIVVANDGTGDFDDPKAAIDSIAANTPTVIYIKNTGTTYTTAATDISGKKIILWGISTRMRFPGGTTVGPSWGITPGNLTMSSSTVLHVIGIHIDTFSTTLGMVAGATLFLDQASLGGGGNNAAIAAGSTYAYQSQFPIHTTSFSGIIDAWDCAIVLPNTTMTLTVIDLSWRDCSLTGGGSTNMTIAFATGSSGQQCSITNCDFGEINALTISGFNQATFEGNTNHGEVTFGPVFSTALKTLTFSSNDYLVVDSTMWGTTLVINTAQFFNLGGIWHTTTLDADGGSVSATFSGDRGVGTFPTSTVTVSGDHIVGNIFVNRGNTNGVLVTGANNVLAVTQTNPGTNTVNVSGNNNKFMVEVGATTADSGAGNVFL